MYKLSPLIFYFWRFFWVPIMYYLFSLELKLRDLEGASLFHVFFRLSCALPRPISASQVHFIFLQSDVIIRWLNHLRYGCIILMIDSAPVLFCSSAVLRILFLFPHSVSSIYALPLLDTSYPLAVLHFPLSTQLSLPYNKIGLKIVVQTLDFVCSLMYFVLINVWRRLR